MEKEPMSDINFDKIEREVFETNNIKEIDLSIPQGRIDVAQMVSRQKDLLPYEGPKDKYNHSTSIGEAIRFSVTLNGDSKGEIVSINKESLFNNLVRVSDYYGHSLVKRPENLRCFLLGRDYRYEEHLNLLEENSADRDRLLFTLVLDRAGSLSSEAFNGSLAFSFVRGLSNAIKSGKITENIARSHPNYPAVEEFLLKSDAQQLVLSDIIFKMLSSYIHTNGFTVPTLNLDIQKSKEVYNLCQEVGDIIINDGVISMALTRKLVYSEANTGIFSQELDGEIKKLTKYVSFFEVILDMYNSQLKYVEPR